MSLFAAAEAENRRTAQPLAARMRPRSLDEFVGQQHFLGEGKLLRRLIKADRLTALLFYGPPGTGKTTLAHLLARETRARFRQLNAVTSGVKELRAVLDEARDALAAEGTRTLLFIDEIHRFNKAQQDALLPDVEEGAVILVGATTANPFFAVNDALVSRSRVFEFQALGVDDITQLLRRAIERGAGVFDFGRSTQDSNTFRFKKQWGALPEPAVWQYHVRRGAIGELNPNNPKYRLMIGAWRRLPLWLTRLIGPRIVRGIP